MGSQCKTSLVNRPAHILYPLNTPSSIIVMIPEAGMTLDSILEGILSERESEEEGGGEQLVSDLRQTPDRLFSYPGYSPVQIKYELDSSPDNSESSPASVFGNRETNPVFPNIVKNRNIGALENLGTVDRETEETLEQCVYSVKTEVPDSCTGDTFTVSYQPDIRKIGGGKILSGQNFGLTDAGKIVQLHLLETGQLHPSQCASSIQVSSPSISISSPTSPDTQQCSSTTHSTHISQGSIKDEDDCPKRVCLVCGDVASGFHYGVSSCEACKAFFKRTIQGNIDYICPVTGTCEINKRRRKACQACRYQKCLRQGMLKEGVRLDRVRGGRQKYRRYPMDTTHGSEQTNKKITLEENKVLESLSQCEPEQLVSLADPSLPSSALKTMSTLSDIYDRELVGTIGWAKQVPGFTALTLNDQMKLLQSSWTEVLTLTLVYRSLPKLGKLNFASDFSLNEEEANECGLESFFEKCMLIVERMKGLGITREEFLILKALVIANSDCQLEEFSAVGQLRENLLSSLQDAVHFIRCGNANLHLQSLLLILPSLRDADSVLRAFWSRVRQDGQVPMNKLLIEMLEA